MSVGLKRGTVEIEDFDPQWSVLAAETINKIKNILGNVAIDIQHIGSTSISKMKAKPILDIAVAVNNLDDVFAFMAKFNEIGFYQSVLHEINDDLLICDGDKNADTRTLHIHIVKQDSTQWKNYIRFRDFLSCNPVLAREYEQVKIRLSEKYSQDRHNYTENKGEIIDRILRKAQVWSFLGKIATVIIDRHIGDDCQEHLNLIYPINYGYIMGEIAPDGKNLGVYVLGIDEPTSTFTGRIIGIVHRNDDIVDKLVAAPEGAMFSQKEIAEAVSFQEQYYSSHIEALYNKSAE